ncbi:MAG: Gfo/Idh/MocA family oxidoreductase [Candidatus Aminicenantes bacterium]|jgi:predicted dehydrogenase
MIDKAPEPVSVVLVGIGGMGYYYLKSLLSDFPPGKIFLCAAVDPDPERSALFSELNNRNIPVFPSLKQVFSSGIGTDLVVISSPIQHHVYQSLEALRAGSHVLCEKPLAATIQEADRLIHAVEREGGWIEIGYQWSFTEAIQKLKKDILNGCFGKPVRAKSFYLWPRDKAYYNRNDWAGRLKDKDGKWILDSPANSAMAHDLHNLFYVLGDQVNRSALPVEVTAELYRAYPIESSDTVACRVWTQEGVEILFYASHSVLREQGPMFWLEFERGTVSFGEKGKEILAVSSSGGKKVFGSPMAENLLKKLFLAVDAVQNPRTVLCGPEASRSQTLCVSGIQDSVEEIKTFAPSKLGLSGERIWVKGLAEDFLDCYEKGILPSEAGLSWASPGKKVNLEGYRFFPGGKPPERGGERIG